MNRMMEYNGYHAKIEYDAEDRIFIGDVYGINDSLNFHGSSVDEIETMFHQSIDNYLKMCREFGKEPDKEYKGTFNIRISPEIHRKAALEAAKNGLTLNQFVAQAIEQSIYQKDTGESVIYIVQGVKGLTSWNWDKKQSDFNAYHDDESELISKEEVLSVG